MAGYVDIMVWCHVASSAVNRVTAGVPARWVCRGGGAALSAGNEALQLELVCWQFPQVSFGVLFFGGRVRGGGVAPVGSGCHGVAFPPVGAGSRLGHTESPEQGFPTFLVLQNLHLHLCCSPICATLSLKTPLIHFFMLW